MRGEREEGGTVLVARELVGVVSLCIKEVETNLVLWLLSLPHLTLSLNITSFKLLNSLHPQAQGTG